MPHELIYDELSFGTPDQHISPVFPWIAGEPIGFYVVTGLQFTNKPMSWYRIDLEVRSGGHPFMHFEMTLRREVFKGDRMYHFWQAPPTFDQVDGEYRITWGRYSSYRHHADTATLEIKMYRYVPVLATQNPELLDFNNP